MRDLPTIRGTNAIRQCQRGWVDGCVELIEFAATAGGTTKNCKSFALVLRLSRINLQSGREGCVGLNSPLLESPAAASYNNHMGNEPDSRAEIQGAPSGDAVKQDNGARIFAVIAIFLFAFYFIAALTTHA